MNSGGEPERDDTGLPPVDIEIPDDARELDRDVQAYYRERRAERRRQRHHRMHGRIARDGIVLPLLACCLILALIAGTLLTVFTATSDQNFRPPVPSAGASRPAGSPASSNSAPSTPAASGPAALPLSPAITQTGKPLPAGTLRLTANNRPIKLRGLRQTMLVLVPPACRCSAAVTWLADIAATLGVPSYLVGTAQTIAEATNLHSGLNASLRGSMVVALDQQRVLSKHYPVRGLTAVLVNMQATSYAQHLSATDNATPLVQALTG